MGEAAEAGDDVPVVNRPLVKVRVLGQRARQLHDALLVFERLAVQQRHVKHAALVMGQFLVVTLVERVLGDGARHLVRGVCARIVAKDVARHLVQQH